MPSYLIGRYFDPVLGIATGVMAYYLWENDPRNFVERPPGRSLHELVHRRVNNIPPPPQLFAAGGDQKSIFSIPSIHKQPRTSKFSPNKQQQDGTATATKSRSTSDIIGQARNQAAKAGGERGADLRALRTAIADEWGHKGAGERIS